MVESVISEENLVDLMALARTAPAGKIAEIGVFKGGSAVRLYEVAEEQSRELHLFDTFCGMPHYDPEIDHFPVGTFLPEEDIVDTLMELMPNAKLHIGIYPETHPEDLADIAFIHVDCDQYLSYRAIIDKMWPLVVDGGMMLFDDYPYIRGAQKAVDESFRPYQLRKHGDHFYVIKNRVLDAI